MNIKIAFTVYNRPDYLEKTLDSWTKVRNPHNHSFIFKVEASDKLKQIVRVIDSFKNQISVPVDIVINDPALGVGKNHYDALSLVFDTMDCDAVIMAEDDIIVSNDILEYFEYAFEKYKNDESVLTACSHRYVEGPNDKNYIIKEQSFDPWTWGTWKNRWTKYLKNNWDLKTFTLDQRIVGGFDYHIVYRILPNNNLVSVFPGTTRSKHIGMNGTHAREESYFDNPYFLSNYDQKLFEL